MEELSIHMKDLKHIYEEVFDGREYDDIPKEELWKYLEDILQLFARMVAVVRIHEEKIDILERGSGLGDIFEKVAEMVDEEKTPGEMLYG